MDVRALAIRPTLPPSAAAILRAIGRPLATVDDDLFTDCPVALNGVQARHILKQRTSFSAVSRATERVLKITGSEPFDVIHAHGMYDIPAGAVARELSRRWSIPYVVSLHGSDIKTNMASQLAEFKRVLDQASALTFVSHDLRRSFSEKGGLLEKSRVVPNGIDPSVFNTTDKHTLKRSGHLRIAYVGNLSPVKGADRLPKICEEVVRRRPNAHFTIVGEGPLRASLERKMHHMPVTFTGFLDQPSIAELMRCSDALIMPSRSEGWPCVVLEAHACGLRVIGTAVGGVPEAVGDAAMVVEPGPDLEVRMAELVSETIVKPVDTATLTSRARRYTWAQVAQEEAAIYEEALSGT
jgi:glycosyltransferase involved in cell wall biosynthesis